MRKMTPKEELREAAANIGAVLFFIGMIICGGAMNEFTFFIGAGFIMCGVIMIYGFVILLDLMEKRRKKKIRKILRMADQIRREMQDAAEG